MKYDKVGVIIKEVNQVFILCKNVFSRPMQRRKNKLSPSNAAAAAVFDSTIDFASNFQLTLPQNDSQKLKKSDFFEDFFFFRTISNRVYRVNLKLRVYAIVRI